jgi:maltose 6'-phosphate phosphatase
MYKIKLLCVENVITRQATVVHQRLSVAILVENVAYEKSVDVKWAGEDGVWHTLRARYHSSADREKEYWVARKSFTLVASKPLPGNVRLALRYRVAGKEYWDNNHGHNYSIQADTGIRLAQDIPVLNVRFESDVTDGQTVLPVVVAVQRHLEPERVTVIWTNDNWHTSQSTHCRFRRNYWDSELRSNARNPNHYGVQVWHAALDVDHSRRIQYRITCDTRKGSFWDDNFGRSYAIYHALVRVLILNLHCYQEDNQDHKLTQIARAINDLDVDVVCLQEVAELWNNGMGDWQSNAARIINDRLRSPYHLVTDWSHLGFDRYREGVAILSRYPIARHEARYVSNNHDPYSIHSRKVVMAQIRVPHLGLVNVFSSHLSWWDDGFAEQFEALRRWAGSEHSGEVRATMLCGDFNVKAGSKGYRLVVDSNEYDDQYLAVNSPQVFRMVFDAKDTRWHRYLDNDHRIDFVFLRKSSELSVTAGREVFTERDYGRVSDHIGYLMTFEPR